MALVLLMQIAFTNVCFAASTSNTITVKGRLTYKYKNSMSDTEKTAPLKNFTVILYDKDIFSSEKLGETKPTVTVILFLNRLILMMDGLEVE